ncbi:MAG: Tad domain-containing protein, partial [Alphaproteobacteria bacterium]|nr:Tad domain-containing protein [Alphaproteobacteria bacterium]
MGKSPLRPETLRSLLGDERGSMLAFFVVSTGVLFSMTALVWDIGRVVSTATDLQSFADHMALAAAGELDGTANARQRAQNVADNLLQDRQSFAAGDLNLTGADVTLRFLRDLPPDDNDAIDAGLNATGDDDAAFVEVTVAPHTVTHIFIGAMEALTGTDVVDTTVLSPRAIAGFTQYVCDITPLMFCAPGPNYSPIPGRQIHLKSGDGWGPGAFGLLDLNFDPDGPCGNPNQGANYFRC